MPQNTKDGDVVAVVAEVLVGDDRQQEALEAEHAEHDAPGAGEQRGDDRDEDRDEQDHHSEPPVRRVTRTSAMALASTATPA
ncbi:MAG: hypothetical protein IPJ59_15005 [Nannocystis sp.]|nr:hypothetical protein [Nannocystis sp.]